MKFSSTFFINNRNAFFEEMEVNSFLVLLSNDQYPKNGDQKFSFRQQSDLYYLTGIVQEETSLVLYKDQNQVCNVFLFLLKPNPLMETWEGKKITKQLAEDISGISEIFWSKQIDNKIKQISCTATSIYLLGSEAFSQKTLFNTSHIRFKKKIKDLYPKLKIKTARPILNSLRLVKSKEEIQIMQKAVDITNLAFKRVLETIDVNQSEYEVEAEISYVFSKEGAKGHAYDPIIASGLNACSLHYVKNDSKIMDGDLVLMDFGANYNYYAADLSRTIPVNGKFSERQKELYEIVLDVQKKSIELFVPGNNIDFVNKKTKQWMAESLKKIGLLNSNKTVDDYFPHGTSHFLGIDVHDVGVKTIDFLSGMVLTCEPGLYIEEENIGIRIENDIVVGEKPIDLMQNTIREIDDIEKYMR